MVGDLSELHSYVYLHMLSGQFRNSSMVRTSFVDLVLFSERYDFSSGLFSYL